MKRFLYLGSLFFIFLLPLVIYTQNRTSPFELPKYCFSAFFIMLLFLSYVAGTFREPIVSVRLSKPLLILSLMLLGSIASFTVSVLPYLSFWGDFQEPSDSLLSVILFFLFAFIILQIIDSEEKIKTLRNVLISVLGIQLLYALAQYSGFGFPWWVLNSPVIGSQGITLACAAVLGCLFPFVLISFFSRENNFLKIFLLSGLIFLTNFVILATGSRTPLIAFWATCSVVALFYVYHRVSFASLKKVFILILLLCTSTVFFKFSNASSEIEYKSNTSLIKKGFSTRKSLFESSIKAWKERPLLGYGPQTFIVAEKPYQTAEMNSYEFWEFGWIKAHNHLLDQLVCQGIVGLLLTLILYGYLLFNSVKLFLKKSHSDGELFALASFAGFNFLFLSNLTSFNLLSTQMLYTVFPVFFSLGTGNVHSRTIILRPALRAMALIAVVLLSGILLQQTYGFWKGDLIIQRWLRNPVVKADRLKSIDLISQAISANPSEPIYYCFAGQVYTEILVRNYKTLKQPDIQNVLNTIDENLTECMSRGEGLDYMIRLSAEVYAELYYQGVLNTPEKALGLYQKLLAVTPFNPKPVLEVGRLKLKMGETQEFINLMNKAISLKSDYLPAYIELTNYYYGMNDLKSVNALADRLSKTEFYAPEFVFYVEDLVTIAQTHNDIEAREKFRTIYEKFKYLIPPDWKKSNPN